MIEQPPRVVHPRHPAVKALDELGIDVLITGSQKALAMPPGLSLASVSKRPVSRQTVGASWTKASIRFSRSASIPESAEPNSTMVAFGSSLRA